MKRARTTFVLAAFAGAAAIGVLQAQAPRPAPSRPQRFVVDSHLHYADNPAFIDTLVRTYRPRNAMACVLTPYQHLEAVKRAAAEYPDVIIPYGRIDVDDPAALAKIDAFVRAGFRGIKMHTPKNDWDDFRYFQLYGTLQDAGLVALFHTGIVSGFSDEPEQSSMARMRPSFLHTIARSFPRLVIQGAHLGNPWYDEAAEAARWEKYLYFDLSGSSLIKKRHNLNVFREYLWWDGPTAHSSPDAVYAFEKLVFGTDEPPENLLANLDRWEQMLDANEVPEASRRRIFGETLARLLKITPRSPETKPR